MKRCLFYFFIISSFIVTSINASCWDSAAITARGKVSEVSFDRLDMEISREINEINDLIKEGHSEIEKDSLEILEKAKKLNKEYYVLEEQIVFKQKIINELNSLVVDAISTDTDMKRGKNSLKLLQKELTK